MARELLLADVGRVADHGVEAALRLGAGPVAPDVGEGELPVGEAVPAGEGVRLVEQRLAERAVRRVHGGAGEQGRLLGLGRRPAGPAARPALGRAIVTSPRATATGSPNEPSRMWLKAEARSKAASWAASRAGSAALARPLAGRASRTPISRSAWRKDRNAASGSVTARTVGEGRGAVGHLGDVGVGDRLDVRASSLPPAALDDVPVDDQAAALLQPAVGVADPQAQQAVAAAQMMVEEGERRADGEGVQPQGDLGQLDRHRVLVDAVDHALEDHAPDQATVVELVPRRRSSRARAAWPRMRRRIDSMRSTSGET